MIGDATRTPIIIDVTKQVFNKTELLRTLNSLECIGRGAALQSAMLSPLFSVSSFVVEEYNALPVSITYRFGADGAPVTKELFKKGSMFPLSKAVTFDNKLGDMDLLVHYTKDQSEILTGLPDQIAQYMVKSGTLKHSENPVGGSKCKFQFKVMNNIHQIPCLESTELIEEWLEEEKVVVKKAPPKPAHEMTDEEAKAAKTAETNVEQEFEIKQKKKTATYPLKFDTQVHSMAPAVRKEFWKLEQELTAEDRKFLDLKEARNDLESYSYDFRNNLAEYGNYEKHALKDVRESFLTQINTVVDWLYEEGENAPLDAYQQRLQAFKAIGAPIKARYVFYSMIDESIKFYDGLVVRTANRLEECEMTDENRKRVADLMATALEFMTRLKTELASKPKTEDCSFTLPMVQSTLE